MKSHTPAKEKKFVNMSLHLAVEDVRPSEYDVHRQIREVARVLCPQCKGKKVVSCACKDCHGRGKAINQALTEQQGVPVLADCKRCGGRGYERIPSTEAHAAVCQITDSLSLDTWKKSVKPFYDQLIIKFNIDEAWADAQLKKITK